MPEGLHSFESVEVLYGDGVAVRDPLIEKSVNAVEAEDVWRVPDLYVGLPRGHAQKEVFVPGEGTTTLIFGTNTDMPTSVTIYRP